MKKDKSTPVLRFTKFKEQWEHKKLSEISSISSGGTPNRSNKNYWNGKIPWVTTTLINFNTITNTEEYITEDGLNNSSAKLFPVGTILMAMYGQGKTRGKVAILGINATTNQACCAITPNPNIVLSSFLFQNLSGRYNEIRELSNTGGQENLNAEIIKNIKISFPSISEQNKVTSFLSTIDQKINQLKNKKDFFEQYKYGVIQKIFSQELKLKNENGKEYPKWEKKQLKDVLIEHLEKNSKNKYSEVFSVAKQKGVINQIEHLGRSFSAKEIGHYKLIHPHDVVYTKSPTADFPFGIIKQNHTGRTGVVSPLYGVFKPVTPEIGFMLHNYFLYAKNTYNYLHPLVQKGAKNTMNITNDDFLNGAKIELPTSLEEQKKIVEFIKVINSKIDYCQTELEQTEKWKKGLLQQMLC